MLVKNLLSCHTNTTPHLHLFKSSSLSNPALHTVLYIPNCTSHHSYDNCLSECAENLARVKSNKISVHGSACQFVNECKNTAVIKNS